MTNPSTQTVNLELSDWITERAEPFTSIEDAHLSPLMERIGDARVVLIGEASHGTSEFYRMRQRITKELIRQKGFHRIAIEGDWPDVEWIDEYVRARDPKMDRTQEAFARFPSWMWRNREMVDFVDWLRSYNQARPSASERVAMHGLDLYSLYQSIDAVLKYLEQRGDKKALESARAHYANLLTYEPEPQDYGQAVLFGMEGHNKWRCWLFSANFSGSAWKRPTATGKTFSTRSKTPGWWPTRRNTTAACFAAGTKAGIYGIPICMKPCRLYWNWTEKARRLSSGRTTRISATRVRRKWVSVANTISVSSRMKIMVTRPTRLGLGRTPARWRPPTTGATPVKQKAVNESIMGSHEHVCHQSGKPQFLLPLRPVRDKA